MVFPMARDESQPAVMQREHKRSQPALDSKRTDNGEWCTLVVHEVSGTWAAYPHGAAQLGVQLPRGRRRCGWTSSGEHPRVAQGTSVLVRGAVTPSVLRTGEVHL